MEQEVQNILETINKGIQELPSYASEGWDVMIHGIRIDGVINLLVLTLLFGVCIAYGIWAYKNYENVSPDFEALYVAACCVMSFVALVVFVASIFIIPYAIRAIITPEYQLLRQFIF